MNEARLAYDTTEERDQAASAASSGRVIAIVNQKGGVGKTTTTVNLGAALTELGRTVIVVDLDPQGNASTSLGVGRAARKHSVYDVITGRLAASEGLVDTAVPGLRLLPSTVDLAGAEIEMVGQFARESLLKQALQPLRGVADLVLVDCPPSLGLLTVNALTAADEVLVPIQCEYFALEGLGQLLRNLRLVQQNVNPNLRLNGIVLTMYDPRTKLSDQVAAEVRAYFGSHVYEAMVPRSVRASEAPGFGMPVVTYDASSRAAIAYRDLGREFVERPPEGVHPIDFSAEPIGGTGPGRETSDAADLDMAGPSQAEPVAMGDASDDAAGSPSGAAHGEMGSPPAPDDVMSSTAATLEGSAGASHGDPRDETQQEDPVVAVGEDMPEAVTRRSRWPFRKTKGDIS
jgi:chromosome partitioning protein